MTDRTLNKKRKPLRPRQIAWVWTRDDAGTLRKSPIICYSNGDVGYWPLAEGKPLTTEEGQDRD